MARATAVWRRSWNLSPSRPASFTAGAHTRRAKFDRRMGSPSGVGNTRPLRSTSGRSSWASSICTSARGMATARRPAAVFEGLRSTMPAAHSCAQLAKVRLPREGSTHSPRALDTSARTTPAQPLRRCRGRPAPRPARRDPTTAPTAPTRSLGPRRWRRRPGPTWPRTPAQAGTGAGMAGDQQRLQLLGTNLAAETQGGTATSPPAPGRLGRVEVVVDGSPCEAVPAGLVGGRPA